MPRFDPRVLVLVPPLLLTAACGTAPEATGPAPITPSAAAPSAAVPEPSESVYVDEEPDPTAAPGDLSDEAQSYLDEALAIELGALEQAPPATAAEKGATLDGLPENPSKVLAALRTYKWLSPEAKELYDQAVAAA